MIKRIIISSMISCTLLVLYIFLWCEAIKVIDCINAGFCTGDPSQYFTETMAQTLALLNGLVSAVVIAELAITEKFKPPAFRSLGAKIGSSSQSFVESISVLYILIWLLTGGYALWISLNNQYVLPSIATLGKTWLGLAISAAYAFFGLGPESSAQNTTNEKIV